MKSVFFIMLFATASCAAHNRQSNLEASGKATWTATVEQLKSPAANYELKIFDEALGDEPIFESRCAEEFSSPGGKRLDCETNSETKSDVVQIVFRDDIKKGALRLQSRKFSDGKSRNLACALEITAGVPPLRKLDCFEPIPSEGPRRAGLRSPFPSTVRKLDLPNAHLVAAATSKRGALYRGMAPITKPDSPDLKSLINDLKVSSFVIFKEETRSEVRDEIDALMATEIKMKRIHHIPFKYKDFEHFEEACTHTIQALQAIARERQQKQNVFLHCTVGEDRTGMLAGIYRILYDDATPRNAFDFEMCEHGYSSGNPQKPYVAVVKPINEELTPVFLKLAYKIEKKEITAGKLDVKVCEKDPQEEEDFTSSPTYRSEDYRCGMSTWYKP